MNEVPPPPALTWRQQCLLAWLFLGLAVVLRSPSFLRSVLDWDESLYFLMAAQWRAGHLPYSTIWDNKPIGIYAIFALFQAVFGERIFAMRFAACVFTALGALAVCNIAFLVLERKVRRGATAIFAGLLFLLCTLSNDGLSANTEIFMASFTSCGVWMALAQGWRNRATAQAFLTGLLAGAAFMVKYVAVFEAPALLALILALNFRRDYLRMIAAFVAGAGVPLAATVALYAAAGQLPLWWSASIAANFRRLAPPIPPGALNAALVQQAWRWGPLYAAAIVILVLALTKLGKALRQRAATAAEIRLCFMGFWCVGAGFGAAAAKSFYDHYFLQLLPVLCVGSAWLLAEWYPVKGRWRQSVAVLLLAGFLILPVWAGFQALQDCLAPVAEVQNGNLVLQRDSSAQIAKDIETAANGAAVKEPLLYVFDGQPIIYALAHQAPPTPYVLPSVLTKDVLDRVAKVDAPAEVQRILSLQPRFIVRERYQPSGSDPAIYAALKQMLAAHYLLWRRYPDMDVYQITSGSSQSR